MPARVFFVCTGNSARSQMAEGLTRALAARSVEVFSAGTHPQGVNPLAVAAMKERGIDISGQRSKRVEEVSGPFDYVITLCDDAAQNCPVIPARRERIHWSLPDPTSAAADNEEQRKVVFRRVRDDIERRIRQWLAQEDLLSISA